MWDHLLLSTDVYPDTLTSELLSISVFDDNTARGDTLIGCASTPSLKRCITQGNIGKEVEIRMDLVSTNSKGIEVHSGMHSLLLITLLTYLLPQTPVGRLLLFAKVEHQAVDDGSSIELPESFKTTPGALSIKCISVANLISPSMFSKIDPYVVVTLETGQGYREQTVTMNNNENPVWNNLDYKIKVDADTVKVY